MAGGGVGGNVPGPQVIPTPPGYRLTYSPNGGAYFEQDPVAVGTTTGQAKAAEINAVSPSMQGLLGALGVGGAGSSTATSGLTGGSGGVSGISGGTGTGVPNISGGTPISDVKPVDMSAANAATFGAAKDQAGQTGRAEIDSMNGLLGATGMLGSGAQVQGTKDIVEQAGQGANDITRQNATTTAANDLDIAKTNQATQLTERGQNISAQQAQAQLAMEQAQLNSQRQLAILQSVLGGSSSGLF